MDRSATRAKVLGDAHEKRRLIFRKQGKLLTCRVTSATASPPIKQRGAEIKGFSAGSRLRLLKFLATIDWTQCDDGRFITLTYPPECEMATKKERNKHRFKFMRYMEKHLKKKIHGVWRLEWMPRQSGPTKGNIAPHFHLILPTVGWIPYEELHLWWQKAIGSTRPVSVRAEVIESGSKCGHYIAKYCGKWTPPLNLDNPLFLNTNGRHYGYFRKGMFRRCPVRQFSIRDEDLQAGIMCIASEYLPWIFADRLQGFTGLGDNADEIEKEIDEIRLARSKERG